MRSCPTELKSSSADREAVADNGSASRSAMVGSHMKGAAPLDAPKPSLHFTGVDTEYAKYVHNEVVEHTGTICTFTTPEGVQRRAVFTRHPKVGSPDIMQTAVFTRRSELPLGQRTPIIDLIETVGYTAHHHVFSSKKDNTELLRKVVRGQVSTLEKGQNITTMPCLSDAEIPEFIDGVPIMTTTISHPDLIEDAYDISEEAAAAMHAHGVHIIDLSIRSDEVLLDTYGRMLADGTWESRYFPDVGEAIRDDGLVLATRRYDPLYAAMDMSAGELRHASPFYDQCRYVDADPEHYKNPMLTNGSRVIDIQVWRDETEVVRVGNGVYENRIQCTEENKTVLDKYAQALKNYYREIVEFYLSMPQDVQYSGPAWALIYRALASELPTVYHKYENTIRHHVVAAVRSGDFTQEIVNEKLRTRLPNPQQRQLREPISTYTIRIAVRYPIPVTVSSKITDRSGMKGIVGRVLPVDKMPLDEFGRRVHCLRPQNAGLRRSTFGGLFHIFWSDASEQLKLRLKPVLEQGNMQEAWATLLDYLSRYNPNWAELVGDAYNHPEYQMELWREVYDFSVRIFLPHELDKSTIDICRGLKEYKPQKSRLLITHYDGRQEWTKEKFYVGYVETLRLDKTGREFSSTSAPQFNYVGGMECVVTPTHGYPVNNKGIKWGGESERRCVQAYSDGYFDEIHNSANNPDLQREKTRGMYRSLTPSNPGVLIDRKKYPLGDSQYDRLIDAIHRSEGFRLVRKKREDV